MRYVLSLLALLVSVSSAQAFCGFYVARADGELYNEASKVVFVRDGRRSTITMSSDYRGDPSEFALIVPTPRVLREDQIREVSSDIIDHLDAYTAPRLVEYFDRDPCGPEILFAPVIVEETAAMTGGLRLPTARDLGVRVEAEYQIGAYDIAILSANESDGLTTYLTQEGYNIPDGADLVLADYIADGMKFFVARVNLGRHSASEAQELEPLQISFRSRNFMLPLQLGKINSVGEQDMIMMMLSREGRVEPTNYRNIRVPSDVNIPVFVEQYFAEFYTRVFTKIAARDTVVTEYAWDMSWCDPCAADPLPAADLVTLGADWVRDGVPPEVFVTRMHVQYDETEFGRDLLFQTTQDRANFQGRYIMNHPFDGDVSCEAGQQYVTDTRARLTTEAATLRAMTDWGHADIIARIRRSVPTRYHP